MGVDMDEAAMQVWKIVCALAISFFAISELPARADPRAPLAPGAQVVQAQNTTVGKNGAYSDLVVPRSVSFTLDYDVESGRQLTVAILTAAQFQQIGQGRKMTGQPLYKFVVQGVGSEARLFVPRGNFVIAFVNYDGPPVRLNYRASHTPM
jgi:hypothetical protein